MSDIKTFVQLGYDRAAPAQKLEFDVRCVQAGDTLLLAMPIEGFQALLDAMFEARGHSEALDTMYEGIRYGFGFKRRDEVLQPEQPEVES